MIFAAPFLPWNDLLSVLVFYIAASSATQYAGSISALLFGLPGETTSLPAVKLRSNFETVTEKRQAIYNTAAGSFIGAMVSLMIGAAMMHYFSGFAGYMRTTFILSLTLLGLAFSVISSDNRWWHSMLLVGLGLLIGWIGLDPATGESFGTFGNTYLMTGIPSIAVMTGIMVVPMLIDMHRIVPENSHLGKATVQIFSWDRLMFPAVRGSMIGFVAGLIPFVGSSMSSMLAYSAEKLRTKDPLKMITSAETADNSAYYSAIVPLLLFGIAIVPSEAILLNMISQSAVKLDWSSVSPIMLQLGALTVIINCICFLLSYNLVDYVVLAYMKIERYVPALAVAGLLAIIYQSGSEQAQGAYFLCVFVVMSVLGILLRRLDRLPLVFAFLIQDILMSSLNRTILMIGS